MATKISINDIIGRLHDSALEKVKKTGSKWFNFGTLRGKNGVLIQNTAISYNGEGKPSTFVGGNGPFKIIAIRGMFTTKNLFIKLVTEYIKWFAGEGNFALSEDVIKTATGKISGERYYVIEYTLDYKTGLERKAPPAPSKNRKTNDEDDEDDDKLNNKHRKKNHKKKNNRDVDNEDDGDNEDEEVTDSENGDSGESSETETSSKESDGENKKKGDKPEDDKSGSEKDKEKDREEEVKTSNNYGAGIDDKTELLIASQNANVEDELIFEDANMTENFITNIKQNNTLDADINLRRIIQNKISKKINDI